MDNEYRIRVNENSQHRTYTITDQEGNNICCFSFKGYPSCCGITLLYDFWCECQDPAIISDALVQFFVKHGKQWQPTIQLVAIRECCEEDEEFDDELDEWVGISTDWNSEYEYEPFITSLVNQFGAKELYEFINPNSSNKCHVLAFRNPALWRDVTDRSDSTPFFNAGKFAENCKLVVERLKHII